MTDLLFYDAAYPPTKTPPGVQDGVCFYIGGDTPHIWTPAEVDAQNVRYRLPIFVRSNPSTGPGAVADVAAAYGELRKLGAPAGTLVAWDMETAVDASYIAAVYGLLLAAGFKLIVYGSQNFVIGNDNPDGLYWGADWTNVPHLHAGDQITQYVSFAGYDESVAESTLPFWDTKAAVPSKTRTLEPMPGAWHSFAGTVKDPNGNVTIYGVAADHSIWSVTFYAATWTWGAPVKLSLPANLV